MLMNPEQLKIEALTQKIKNKTKVLKSFKLYDILMM